LLRLPLLMRSSLPWADDWPAGHPKSVSQGRIDRKMEGPDMWAQIIKMRLRPEREKDLPGVLEQLQALEQPGSGLLRTIAMRDQNDPSGFYVLVVFESEEKARAREQDPRRQEGMKSVQAAMAELFDGPPEFVDLTVLQDVSP
jgi:quinol monooxygenase YgiN